MFGRTSQADRRRGVRRILAVVLLLEALLAVGAGALLAVETARGRAAEPTAAVVMVGLALGLAAALLLLLRATLRARWSARAPIIVWQLLQLSVAYRTLGTTWLPLGIALTILAGVAIGAALWPGVLSEGAPAR